MGDSKSTEKTQTKTETEEKSKAAGPVLVEKVKEKERSKEKKEKPKKSIISKIASKIRIVPVKIRRTAKVPKSTFLREDEEEKLKDVEKSEKIEKKKSNGGKGLVDAEGYVVDSDDEEGLGTYRYLEKYDPPRTGKYEAKEIEEMQEREMEVGTPFGLLLKGAAEAE